MNAPFHPTRRSLLRFAGIAGALSVLQPVWRATASAQMPTAAGSPIMRAIPKTGEMVPAMGLGTFETFDIMPGEPRDHVREVIRRFHAAGGRVVDTSPLYGMSEVSVGDFATELGIAGDLFITNKTWTTGEYLSDNSHSEAQFRRSTERLWRNRMDVQQVHSLENFDQVLHLLRQWKDQGRVRYIGVTQWSPEYHDTLERLVQTAKLDFIQVNYTIFSRQAENRLLPACIDNGIAVQINIPFEKARLFTCVQNRPLPDFAAEFGATTWAQFFLKYIISQPGCDHRHPGNQQSRSPERQHGRALRGASRSGSAHPHGPPHGRPRGLRSDVAATALSGPNVWRSRHLAIPMKCR